VRRTEDVYSLSRLGVGNSPSTLLRSPQPMPSNRIMTIFTGVESMGTHAVDVDVDAEARAWCARSVITIETSEICSLPLDEAMLRVP